MCSVFLGSTAVGRDMVSIQSGALQKNNGQNNRFGSFNHIKIWFETNLFKAK